jgi:hypothetical protein
VAANDRCDRFDLVRRHRYWVLPLGDADPRAAVRGPEPVSRSAYVPQHVPRPVVQFGEVATEALPVRRQLALNADDAVAGTTGLRWTSVMAAPGRKPFVTSTRTAAAWCSCSRSPKRDEGPGRVEDADAITWCELRLAAS